MSPNPPWHTTQGTFSDLPCTPQNYLQDDDHPPSSIYTSNRTYQDQLPGIQLNIPGVMHSPDNKSTTARLISVAPSASANSSQASQASEHKYLDPHTGRPLRAFLLHERALLQTFYLVRNPTASTPSYHQAILWWLNLPNMVYDEWNQFVLDRQSRAEAQDRTEAVNRHLRWLREVKLEVKAKFRSEHRGNEFGVMGRKPGGRNKRQEKGSGKKVKGAAKHQSFGKHVEHLF
jgi:hypothetical protein